ncbi:HlyD family efflux transporter periplasmic adaptor subunit [Thioclava electrotropha]|uniref:HlyD family efflux transporter periplasmic adaptor subunit n=1 Tax=Thioclava electrotropha TaxID=1549850 RepID=A0ABX6YZZ9_9RHOB|nr:HlyD family efflux transporter periplasmic adaptor subunit [Thioclava electrotropha]QPZ93355.1 HlyD family efflux transporter periplasmic adaptor subunit [Thioclava electrotropha]
MSSSSAIDPSFIDGTHRRQTLKVARNTIRLVAGCVLIALIWAGFAQIDEVTRGDGRVVPLSRLQSIQSLEGGIISKLMVHEGDLVKPGQILVKMDPTQARSDYLQTKSEMEVLEAEIARLQAEVLEKPDIGFPAKMSEIEATEEKLFKARREKLEQSLKAIRDEEATIQKQIDITQPLTKDQSVSQIDLLKLEQQKATLVGKETETRNSYVQDAYKDLADRKAKLASLKEGIIQKEDQFKRTDIRSPVAGRVNNINITTLGGVVQPGQAIMEVTPIDDQLLIETRVRPRDVAFIAPGMPASVKITAYDYTVYGDLKGTVTQISEDTVQEKTQTGEQEYYKVMVKTDRNYLERGDQTYPIRPGMVAQVDIKSGQRSVLSYLMRPLLRAQLR